MASRIKLYEKLSKDSLQRIKLHVYDEEVIKALKSKCVPTELTLYEAMAVNWAIFGQRSSLDYNIFTSLFNNA